MNLKLIPFLFILTISFLSRAQTIENEKYTVSGENVIVSFNMIPKHRFSRGDEEIYTPTLIVRAIRSDGAINVGESKEINLPNIEVKSGANSFNLDAYNYFGDYIGLNVKFEIDLKLDPIFVPIYFTIDKEKFKSKKDIPINLNEWGDINIKYTYSIKSNNSEVAKGDVLIDNITNKKILEIKDKEIPKGKYILEITSNGFGYDRYQREIEITKPKKGLVIVSAIVVVGGVVYILMRGRGSTVIPLLPNPPDPNG